MIRSPVLGLDCEENGVTHRFVSKYDMLEFIVIIEAG